ncbi:hypothetical protein PLEOSDRAFT_1100043 [Pleurotus ostreatus PC15]|uniref:Uncharacterized protein n=1 Tax=Pleurotus ostreatus (strain PC15) TaxID=1137138 RepID=A0A067P4D2_PLEO1|nr:hypothetical protein PLEOSDRAFT_1100043 [Pleurotus ostreatus PC15]
MSFYLLCGIVTTIVLTSSSSPFYFPRLSTSPTAQTQQIITYIQNLRDTAGEAGGIPRPQIPSLPSLRAVAEQAASLALQHTFSRDPRDLIPCIALFAVVVGVFKHKIDITERDIALITHISAFAAASHNNPHTLLLDIDPTVYRQIAAHLRRLTPPEYFPSQSRWDTHTIMLAWEPLWRLCANTLASAHDNDPARRALSAFYSQPTAAQFHASDHGPSVQTLIESANPILREGVTPNASPFLSTSVVGRPLVAFTRWIFRSQNERGSPAPGNVEAGNGARRDGNSAAFIPEWMPMAAGIIVASILHASEASV